ncbi:hypothetical protein PQQ88_01305 [Paraburkholderia caledonica]|uniref:hypothetical protein n=1 Tax=Paraburkholderia caledonica TaxID=134536 RepID=UPI0038BA6CAC
MVAAAVAGAAVVGGVASSAMSSSASRSAANTQSDAAKYSADLQNDQWQQTQQNLKPYMDLGASYINPLKNALSNPMLTQQFAAPTEQQAQSTPGYQFTLNQGLKSVQNSAAARGLGVSGAALKGAASYTTGLADSTYNDVFNRALQTFNTNYSSAANNVNRLAGVVGSGQNAAATNGSLGAQAVGNIGNTLTSGANAQAAGTIGAANALSNGLNGITNGATSYALLSNNAGAAAPSSASMAAGSNGYGFTV